MTEAFPLNSKWLWFAILALVGLFLISPRIRPGQTNELTVNDVHGPHGGHTLKISPDMGYWLELTLYEERQEVVIYTFEKLSQDPISIPATSLQAKFESDGLSFCLNFLADPRPTDPKATCSRFSLDLSEVPQQLLNADEFTVYLSFKHGAEEISASMTHYNDHHHDYIHD